VKTNRLAAAFLFLLAPGASWASTVSFSLIHAPDMNPLALAGFQAAANSWSSLFDNNVNVVLAIGLEPLGASILGSTSTTEVYASYSAVRTQLAAGASPSAVDRTAIQNLGSGADIPILINHTTEHPGSAYYVDDNNSLNNANVLMSAAEAKALGFTLPGGITEDAAITFSSNFSWDYNPSDGITPGLHDFVGVATHEIGHALGFLSEVDELDYDAGAGCVNSPNSENSYFPTVLDLFRYSTTSASVGAIDLTADSRSKYFSVDGGTTLAPQFSNGVNCGGDGRQASHWKDNLGIGIMDPTAATGERLVITRNDLDAFDAIGWNLSVPEPASLLLCAAGLAALAIRRKRREP